MRTLKHITTGLLFLVSISIAAQQGINYKALVKDGSGNIIANDLIAVQFQILQGVGMTIVYQETHTPTTDANGLIILNIGKGNTSDTFTDIDWGADDHYLNVQINTGGGLTDMGTTQFMAVPYALNAANVTGLEAIDEGNGPGWRLIGRNTANYGNIGIDAIDLSISDAPSEVHGAIGEFSTAMGWRTIAGAYSTAMGFNSIASGEASTAMGSSTEASGQESTAMGANTEASGLFSTAMGVNTTAFGVNSTAMGFLTEALGDYSTAMGSGSTASGDYSTAMGENTTASGEFSTAMGWRTIAGAYSTAMGVNSIASGEASTAMGSSTEASGQESTAMGANTEASGLFSTAMGVNTTAFGVYSTAMGFLTEALGDYSTAMGSGSTASGDYSTAMGESTTASGEFSTAMGLGTKTNAYRSTAIGYYNIGGGNPSSPVSTDPLFEIGNGTSSVPANALTVLQNGNTSIGNNAPGSHRLYVESNATGAVGTTGIFINTAASGIALAVENSSSTSSDNVFLVSSYGSTGNLASFDSYQGTGSWNRRFRFTNAGDGRCDGAWIAGGADYAEYFPKANTGISYEPGDVIAMSPSIGYTVESANAANANLVIGVYSSNPAIVGNSSAEEDPKDSVLVGLMGVISTKVNTENGPIKIGDFLTISSTSGVATKANRSGMVIGRAMENYTASDQGMIKVLVATEWITMESQMDVLKHKNEVLNTIVKSLTAELVETKEEQSSNYKKLLKRVEKMEANSNQ